MGSSRREPGALTLAGLRAAETQTHVAPTAAASPHVPVALYVHFPFCVSVCPYCDFVVFGGRAARGPENRIATVVDALVAEIALRGRTAHLGSLYIGGGTPSLMSAEQVSRLIAATDSAFGLAEDAEITLEVNPGATDRGDINGFAAAGVNRISIGAQSLDAAELQTLGRRHDAADVRATIRLARDAGIRSVSMDLLYDVPGQTIASWSDSLDGTLALEPDHVSAYALTLDEFERADDHLLPTRGGTQWRARARPQQDEDRAAEMYELADDRFARAGLSWYEISNWSASGHESWHNNVYWSGRAWEAVGPGAHAFDGRSTRRWNAANLERYVSALGAGQLPPGSSQPSSAPEAAAEQAILSLRTVAGMSSEIAQLPSFQSGVSWAVGNGLLERNEEGVRLTLRGRLLSNEVFSRLLPEPVAQTQRP